jgi:hypothetical protein
LVIAFDKYTRGSLPPSKSKAPRGENSTGQ